MLGNFIYAKTKDLFIKQLDLGHVSDEAIVFIEDTKLIWNHGTYFDCSVASEIFEEYKNTAKQSIDGKVDKVSGKQLSTEDFTTALKTKLEDLKIHRKIYQSLSSTSSEDYGWYMIAEIDDTESTLFQVSTGGHSDVIFAVSTGWGGNLGGSLTVLNTYFSESNPDDVNEHHAHVVAVRIRKNNNKVQVEVKLKTPTRNNSTYVNIVISAYTNAGHPNFLLDSLNLASSNDNTLQTFELQNQALMSGKVVTSEIQADNLATVATTGDYNDLINKPTLEESSFKWSDLKYEPVDLGLPSGIRWASFNMGALSPGELGQVYAWGDSRIGQDSYVWGLTLNKFSKYCTKSIYGEVDNKTILDLTDDTARVKWGGRWRMPTELDFLELLSECVLESSSFNGKDGYKFTGPNNNSIFLPTAQYFSSQLSTDENINAYSLYVDGAGSCGVGVSERRIKLHIRPVLA